MQAMTSRVVPFAALIAVACSCDDDSTAPGGNADASADASGDAPSDAASDVALETSTDAADAQACNPVPTQPEIPKGWLRFPGLPCKCDIWMAPNSAAMLPKPVWITTPPGVLELEHNWGDPKYRIFPGSAYGGSHQGKQHVSFMRDLGNKYFETVVIRLPDNEVVFQVRVPDTFCDARIFAMGQGKGLLTAWESVQGFEKGLTTLWTTTDQPAPQSLFSDVGVYLAQGFAVSSTRAAWLLAPNTLIQAFDLKTKSAEVAWTAPDHRAALSNSLRAWDDALFWDTHGPEPWAEVWIWTPGAGAKIMLPHTGNALGQVGSTCGLGTDGKTMVWTQASGWTGTEWQTIEIFKAPHTTDPKALKPMKVRDATGGKGPCKPWIVNGDYAATTANHDKTGSSENFLPVVLRLSDGVRWKVDRRPGRLWGRPLYVTDTEVAFEEGLPNNSDSGVTPGESWSIVRYPLSLLGPGVPP